MVINLLSISRGQERKLYDKTKEVRRQSRKGITKKALLKGIVMRQDQKKPRNDKQKIKAHLKGTQTEYTICSMLFHNIKCSNQSKNKCN